jgi:gluconolactonase
MSTITREATPSFLAVLGGELSLRKLWTGGTWLEGPAWLPERGLLVFSDIPSDRMMCWSAADEVVRVFRAPSAAANGNTTDNEGRLVTCEQATRRLTRLEPDGHTSVLIERFGEGRFNAPNDAVVDRDDGIWFTDPDYGRKFFDGPLEQDGSHVYRLAPDGVVSRMTTDMVQPNGLAFSPDQRRLYVIDTGSTHVPGGPNHVEAFDVMSDWSLRPDRIVYADPQCLLDGLRVDRRGWLWLGTGDGVTCLKAEGDVLARIVVPERVANLCFGGEGLDQVFLCATTSLYVVEGSSIPYIF